MKAETFVNETQISRGDKSDASNLELLRSNSRWADTAVGRDHTGTGATSLGAVIEVVWAFYNGSFVPP